MDYCFDKSLQGQLPRGKCDCDEGNAIATERNAIATRNLPGIFGRLPPASSFPLHPLGKRQSEIRANNFPPIFLAIFPDSV